MSATGSDPFVDDGGKSDDFSELLRGAQELLEDTDATIKQLQNRRLPERYESHSDVPDSIKRADSPEGSTQLDPRVETSVSAALRLSAASLVPASSLTASIPQVAHSISADDLRDQAIALHAKLLAQSKLEELGLSADDDGDVHGSSQSDLRDPAESKVG